MKKLLRHIIIDTFCLYLVTKIASGIEFEKGFNTLFLAGISISVVSFIAKPVINLLLLPINLVTFGLFRWVASSIVLYLTTLIIQHFNINYFHFGGLVSKWIELPVVDFDNFLAFIGFSFIFSVISSFIYWLIK